MKTLVTGATGNVGREVTRQLVQSNHDVSAASRKGKAVYNVSGVEFDYEKPETYENALNEVESVFIIAPPLDPNSNKKVIPFIDAAKEAGVGHILFLSAFGVDQNPEAGLSKIEQHIKESGLKYSILRPGFFMENFTTGFAVPMIEHAKGLFLSAGDGKTSFISVVDIAKVAVAIYSDIDRHNTHAYNLTGSEALDHFEVAKLISEQKNEKINYVPISEEEMKKASVENGLPGENADMLIALYQAVSAGYCAAITEEVKNVTGDNPKTLKELLNQ